MIALLGGLIAATSWGCSSVLAGRASRQIGGGSTLALMALSGVALMLPIALWRGLPTSIDLGDAVLLIVAASGSMIGLRFTYAALARGKVGLVTAIVSTEGAIAALTAVAFGERLGVLLIVGLVAITAGVAAVGLGQHADDTASVVADNRRAAVYAGGASVVFGVSLWASGVVGGRVGDATVVLLSRIFGVVVIAIPLILRGQLQTARPALWLALLTGVVECVGFLGFLWGAGEGLAVAAVVATQYAVVATILSRILFKERLAPIQLVGIAVVLSGVALIAVSRSI